MYRTSITMKGDKYIVTREWNAGLDRWAAVERFTTKSLHIVRRNAAPWIKAAAEMFQPIVLFVDPIELKDYQVNILVEDRQRELASVLGIAIPGSPVLPVAVNYEEAELKTVVMLSDPELAKAAEVQAILTDMANALNVTVEEAQAIFSNRLSDE